MDLSVFAQSVQLTAWFLALIEVILGLYLLVLNAWHTANRQISVAMLLFALHNFALGLMLAARSAAQAEAPAILTALTTPLLQPALLISVILLLRPEWLRGRSRLFWWPAYLLFLSPVGMVLLDVFFDTGILYTGLQGTGYRSGMVPLATYTQGAASPYPLVVGSQVAGVITLLLLAWLVFFNRRASRLGGVLLAAQAMAVAITILPLQALAGQTAAGQYLPEAVRSLAAGALLTAAYGFAGLRQTLSEKHVRQGSLQTRLTALVLIVSLPLLIAVSGYGNYRAQQRFEQDLVDQLTTQNRALSDSLALWLDANARVLQEMARRPDLASMEAGRQVPAMQSIVASYPYFYLASTVDLDGTNVARSDGGALLDYSDRQWFQQARQGAPITYQVVTGRTSRQPALVLSAPIRDAGGAIVGVGMFAMDLSLLTVRMQASRLDEMSLPMIIDEQGRVIAHPERTYFTEQRDLSGFPPVSALLQGTVGTYQFSDESGGRWVAGLSRLPNGWGLVVQMPLKELLFPIRSLQAMMWVSLGIGAVLLLGMSWFTIRQSFRPIQKLTETATAITAGDLERTVPVENEDEIGSLARAFNGMTAQLKELIHSLEQRVSARTREVERRAMQLQVTAEIAREAAAIHDLERLLEKAVHLISSRFGFYHAGIFLMDEAREYAVLRAASSEGGQYMLDRRHRLKVGAQGIVGFVVARREPRLALDVGQDATFFDNPDLPETRSEVALPLIARGQVIGVLDVQSTQAAAFGQEDLEVLQILADQIAVAIDNARLHAESRQAVQELEAQYRRDLRQAWSKQLGSRPAAFSYSPAGILEGDAPAAWEEEEAGHVLRLPIVLRGQRLGALYLRREAGAWLPEEVELVEETLAQVAGALDNARLLAQVQRSAYEEQLVSHVAEQAQSSLDLETVLRTTVQEIGRVMNVSKVQIRLGS